MTYGSIFSIIAGKTNRAWVLGLGIVEELFQESGKTGDVNHILTFDRLAPRAGSAAVRQNPRPSGRGGFTK